MIDMAVTTRGFLLVYDYYWRVRTRLPERRGMVCAVVARGKLGSVLVRFPDGAAYITGRTNVRLISNHLDLEKRKAHAEDQAVQS